MKIQLLSDLHIEHFPSFSDFQSQYKTIHGNFLCEKVYGEVVVLAGDIGDPFQQSYYDFVKYCSEKYKAVMIVAGNHEFYGHEYFSTVEQIRNITRSFRNVYYLNRDVVELTIDGNSIVFLGCTLWSFVPNQAMNIVQNSMNDYRCISINNNGTLEKLTVQHTSEIFKMDARWICSELKKHQNRQVVICTHHAPFFKGVASPYYENSSDQQTLLSNHAFASDLSQIIKNPIIMWAFGHTHYSSVQVVNNVFLASNQLGYISKNFASGESDNKYREDLYYDSVNKTN